jgi:pilus assembly protein Flp/PilA
MLHVVSRLLKDQEGVTAIEYALVASIISLAVVPLLGTICTSLKTTFSKVASSL